MFFFFLHSFIHSFLHVWLIHFLVNIPYWISKNRKNTIIKRGCKRDKHPANEREIEGHVGPSCCLFLFSCIFLSFSSTIAWRNEPTEVNDDFWSASTTSCNTSCSTSTSTSTSTIHNIALADLRLPTFGAAVPRCDRFWCNSSCYVFVLYYSQPYLKCWKDASD